MTQKILEKANELTAKIARYSKSLDNLNRSNGLAVSCSSWLDIPDAMQDSVKDFMVKEYEDTLRILKKELRDL